MSLEEKRKEIVEGPILPVLVKLSLPLVVTQLIQVLYNLVDMFWLGKVGTAALSAPTTAWSILVSLMAVNFAIAIPSSALVAQYMGKRELRGVKTSLGTALTVSFLAGLLLSLLVLPLTRNVVSFVASGNATPEAEGYMFGILLFLPFTFLSMTVSFVLRSLGEMWKVTGLYGATVVLNVLLDPLFIFGIGPLPSLGTLGAGLATGISSAIAALLGLSVLTSHGLKPKVGIDKDTLKRVARLGVPVFASYFLNGTGIMATVKLFSLFGTAAIAAYGIVQRVARFSAYIAFGTAGATFTMVGQNLGNDNRERAKRSLRTSVFLTVGSMLIISLFLGLFGREISGLFTDDPAVVDLSAKGLLIYAPTMPFLGIVFPVSSALNAAGKTLISSALGIGRFWLIRIPVAYLLSQKLGTAVGVFLGIGIANLVTGLVALYFLFNTKWLRRIV